METNTNKPQPDPNEGDKEIKRPEPTPVEIDPIKHPHNEPAEENEQTPREHPHRYTPPETKNFITLANFKLR